jgi:hypothetical protein
VTDKYRSARLVAPQLPHEKVRCLRVQKIAAEIRWSNVTATHGSEL